MNVTYHISWHVNDENLSSDIWKVENTFMSFSNTLTLMDAYDIPYKKSIRKMLDHQDGTLQISFNQMSLNRYYMI